MIRYNARYLFSPAWRRKKQENMKRPPPPPGNKKKRLTDFGERWLRPRVSVYETYQYERAELQAIKNGCAFAKKGANA
jgi:hypothetical protein